MTGTVYLNPPSANRIARLERLLDLFIGQYGSEHAITRRVRQQLDEARELEANEVERDGAA